MQGTKLSLNGDRFLVIDGVDGPKVFVKVRGKWSGGSVSPEERDQVLELVRNQ